jgi:hypothetical protein
VRHSPYRMCVVKCDLRELNVAKFFVPAPSPSRPISGPHVGIRVKKSNFRTWWLMFFLSPRLCHFPWRCFVVYCVIIGTINLLKRGLIRSHSCAIKPCLGNTERHSITFQVSIVATTVCQPYSRQILCQGRLAGTFQ